MVLRCTALLVLDLSSKLHAWRGVSVLWLHFYTVSRDEEAYDDTQWEGVAAVMSCIEWSYSNQEGLAQFPRSWHISNCCLLQSILSPLAPRFMI